MDHNKAEYRVPVVGEDCIIGYTDRETVKLDLDNTDFHRVKSVARWLMKEFNLGGFIILRSSNNSYHVVFNRSVTWAENLRVVAWVCLGTDIMP